MNQGGNNNQNNQLDTHSEFSSKTNNSIFTPFQDVRYRGYLGSSMKRPIIVNNLSSNDKDELGDPSSETPNPQQILWGTNINLVEISSKVRNFYVNFRIGDDPYYVNLIQEIKETEIFQLTIDGTHIHSFDPALYSQICKFPSEMIPIMDVVANNVYSEFYGIEKNLNNTTTKLVNLEKSNRIRDLGPNDIDKLISITGLVIRGSEIVPEMREAFFKCTSCNKIESSILQRSKITEPNECKNCKAKFSFEIIHNRSIYSDKQHIKLQETPDHMPEGETPITIHLCCYDELVDSVRPGDRCEVVGIFRAQGLRVNPKTRTTRSVYRTYVDVVSFTKYNKKKLNINEDEETGNMNSNDLNEEQLVMINREVDKLSRNPDIYNILVDSFAPNIWENEDVKKGLLLQLFGGVSKDFSQSGRGRFRGDINVLLIGDPSTAKSQLLQYVHNLAPRGIYTSGKGSSVVGLTAYVTKDPETKDVVLESGALVLSDKVILHEAMEQQTISIAKAGIICQLNARAAILASANPIHSKYDPKLSVVANIRLPPTLMSRFDLIYLMLDRHIESYDRRLANHIISLYGKLEEEREIQTKFIPKEVLTAYISKARKHNPKITDSIMEDLCQIYLEMRKQGNSKNTISATPRQLESLIRLSEARARLRFSPTVDKEDVDEAIRLIKVATQQAATDPTTGVIDMDLLNTGMTTSSRQKLNQLTDTIRLLLRDNVDTARKGVKFASLYEEVKKSIETSSQPFQFSEFELRDSLRLLEEDGTITLLGNKKVPIIRLIGYQYQ